MNNYSYFKIYLLQIYLLDLQINNNNYIKIQYIGDPIITFNNILLLQIYI